MFGREKTLVVAEDEGKEAKCYINPMVCSCSDGHEFTAPYQLRTIRYLRIGAVVVGFLAVTFGCITGLMWFTEIYVDSILNVMTIRPESQVLEAWRKPSVQPLICIHVYNYTNLERFNDELDDKIVLQQVGPYCYRESLEKKNITWNPNNTITYGDTRTHVFEPDHSAGTEDDILLVPNLALIAVTGIMKDYSFLTQKTVQTLLNAFKYNHSLMRVKAKDFFWGYDDKLIQFSTKLAKLLGQSVPFEKFGILSRRAAITEETITVATGTNDLERIGVVTEVDGKSELDVWGDPQCDRIDGSDGAFFPRHGVNETSTIYLFHRDLCRRMPFVYQKQVEFQDDVMAMRFHAAPTVYNTEGTCYCVKEPCSPKGVFDLSPCAKGAPIMMSFPHFLYGDEKLFEYLEGLSPDPQKHEFYIDVNGMLGFTLGTVSRLQLNLQVKKPDYMYFLDEFPDDIILPIVWIQVSAERLPPDLYNMIYHATVTVPLVQTLLRWGCLAFTIALVLVLSGIVTWKSNSQPLDTHHQHEAQEMLPSHKPDVISPTFTLVT